MVRRIKAYDSRFKASIAISALSEAKSLLEIGSEHNVPKSNIIEWRDKLIAGSPELFIPLHEKNKQIRLLKQEIESLHKVLGEVTVENSFLKKKLKE